VPTWTAGSKEAVGTATNTQSHVWFTLENGILTEVYYPRLDTANLRTLEFAGERWESDLGGVKGFVAFAGAGE